MIPHQYKLYYVKAIQRTVHNILIDVQQLDEHYNCYSTKLQKIKRNPYRIKSQNKTQAFSNYDSYSQCPWHNMLKIAIIVQLACPAVPSPVIVPSDKTRYPRNSRELPPIKVTCSPGAYYRHNNLRKPKGWHRISAKTFVCVSVTRIVL